MNTESRIREHEGREPLAYQCSGGFWTAGIGRNLEAVPFSDDEIELMFKNDMRRARDAAQSLPGYFDLNEVRRGVLVEMCFQMGYAGVRGFKRFIAAYQRELWQESKAQLLDSQWAIQTPKRARRLADLFLTGEYDT